MEMPVQSGVLCDRCGEQLEPARSEVAGGCFCRACRLAPPPFAKAVAFGPYEEKMRAAIHAFKYDRVHSAARELGRRLAAVIGQLADVAPDELLVVPVPLHRSKMQLRGFNQARALAEEAIRFLHRSHPQWKLTLASRTLLRQRATESQAGLTSRQRRLNVRGAFAVSIGESIAGKDILLVDDIFTTGATARSASQALLNAGAASVWVATLARARRFSPAPFDFVKEMDFFDAPPRVPEERRSPGLAPTPDFEESCFPLSHDQPSF
jgi:ComF family protein